MFYPENFDALLPCPFCGAQPRGPYKVGDSGDERTGYNFAMRISCACGVAIDRPSRHNAQGWCNDTGQAADAVVQAWNRRAGSSDENNHWPEFNRER